MNKRHLLSLYTLFLKIIVPAFFASLLSPEPLFAQTTTDNFIVTGDIVFYETTFNDGCRVGNVFVQGDSFVKRDTPSPTNTLLLVFVTISGKDLCHGGAVIGFFGSTIFESSQSGVQFSTQGSANGTKPPQAATMYGEVPNRDGSDTATFNIDLTAGGLAFDELDTNKASFPISAIQVVTMVSHSDVSTAPVVRASLTLSTQKLGTIPVSAAGHGYLEASRGSQLTVTH